MSHERIKAHLYALNLTAYIHPSCSNIKMPEEEDKPPMDQRMSGQHSLPYCTWLLEDWCKLWQVSSISKGLGYVNDMIKRQFFEFARGKQKSQNKDPTVFHVVGCSPLHHHSEPKGKLCSTHIRTPELQACNCVCCKSWVHLISDLAYAVKCNKTHLVDLPIIREAPKSKCLSDEHRQARTPQGNLLSKFLRIQIKTST